MKLRSAVIVLLFISSVLSGCAGDDSENDERIDNLELDLADSIANYNDSLEQISTLERALFDANATQISLTNDVNELNVRISEIELQKQDLTIQRNDLLRQLDESEENNSYLQEAVDSLDQQIINLDNQISDLVSDLQQSQQESNELETTIAILQDTLDSLIYSMTYVIDDCPIDNPGLMINVGYDNGEGLGIQGDGLVTFDEIEYTIGECPGNLGRVFNESTEEHDWGPQRTVIMNGVLYFIFDDGEYGWELWRSDGTLSGSHIVKDIRGEDCIVSTDPETGEQYDDCTNWGSTFDLSWDNVFNDQEIVAGNNKIFFTASMYMYAENNGGFPTLWVSDGTEEGTNLVYDFWSNWDYNCDGCEFDNAGITELVAIPGEGGASDRVVFSSILAKGGMGEQGYPKGEELWISDGTTAGTRMIANIEPETSSWTDGNGVVQCCADWDGSVPRDMVYKGNQVWFTAQTESYGRELYRFGLQLGGGLFLVKDINPGNQGSDPQYLTPASGGIYLRANDGLHGNELHYSQGDAFSTNVVKDIWPGVNNSSWPDWLTKFNDKLIFTANDGQNGRELWITDNTEDGTFMIKDINPGGNSSFPNGPMKVLNGELYFSADDGIHGQELWKTDGTEQGTVMVKDINPGENRSLYWGFRAHWHGEYTLVVGDYLYFDANDGENGNELWRTDGTEEGTELLLDGNTGGDSNPWWMVTTDNKLYFTAFDGEQRVLWRYWDNPGPVLS